MTMPSKNNDKIQHRVAVAATAASTEPFPQRRTVIVCARHIRPAAMLRRIFDDRPDIAITDTRNLSTAERELTNTPDAALVVAVCEAWLGRLFDRMPMLFGAATTALYPRVRCFAIVPDSLAVYRLPLREAGVADLVTSLQSLRTISRSIMRHFDLTPPKPQTLPQRILAALPWQ